MLSRNFGRGPGQIMLNMRVGKTFAFGSSREGGSASTARRRSPAEGVLAAAARRAVRSPSAAEARVAALQRPIDATALRSRCRSAI